MQPISDICKMTPYSWDDSKLYLERPDYYTMLQSMGYEIAFEESFGSYQGDTMVLFKDGDRYGYLMFGWGSCSGCDALQACDTVEDVESLRDNLHQRIQWETKADMLRFFQEHDWEGDWLWHEDEAKAAVEKVIALLSSEAS